ncbi:DUF3465 domain-containing protein [Amphritea sp. 1_MG-2023]|uniref:DUF3465 domain-containing protein n=1 Tax=Amphritea sp. 1_MG-2023 TaxID=3062670 RepID=UPI0026E157EE|nr:DUF3465 domain-containing protein [Amphritea sp. 1_MG-2023]MDO6564642.1 DUF3465 domain-containing protein [Amphritea sp. 1_MG-2023]
MPQQTGTLAVWKDDRGFGFIKSSGHPDVFVHRRDFGNIPRRPKVGDILTFQPMKDNQGRLRAADVRIEGVSRQTSRQSSNARLKHKPPRPHSRQQRKRFNPISAGIILIIVIALLSTAYQSLTQRSAPSLPADTETSRLSVSDTLIQQAYRNRQSNLQVTGSGIVSKVLPDDRQGSQHQRFILRLATGQTILIAHNIDLAPRIPALKPGDSVNFKGEYEWNNQGGVVHWTHLDPQGRHQHGWLEHQGQRYQ